MSNTHVSLIHEPIDIVAVSRLVEDHTHGAVVLFQGIVRGETDGRMTDKLLYEAHHEMALEEMRSIAGAVAIEFEARTAIVHRLGYLSVGEVSVVCAAGCHHRDAAFHACQWLIDRVKAEVPIWKKEFGPDGAEWVHPTVTA